MKAPLRILFLVLAGAFAVVGVMGSYVIGLAAAMLLAGLAFRGGENPLPLPPLPAWMRAGSAHGIGAAALAASFLASLAGNSAAFNWITAGLWLASMAMVVWAAVLHDQARLDFWRNWRARLAGSNRRAIRNELGVIGLITLTAFLLRWVDLKNLPYMHGDEGEMGLVVFRVLGAGDPIPLFGSTWGGLPDLFHFIQAASMTVFGRDIIGLRMVSVLAGVASILLVYWLGRIYWGRFAGATAAWLMTVSHLHIQYSRMGTIFMQTVLMMVLFMLLMAKARQQSALGEGSRLTGGKILYFAAAGLVVGFSQNLYYASRLIPIIAAALLVFLWFERKASLKQIAACGLAALIAFAPLGFFFIREGAVFFNRINAVNVFSRQGILHTLGAQAQVPADLPLLLKIQLERNLGFFMQGGDVSGFYFYGIPAFDSLTLVLFWLGLGIALTRLRRFAEYSILVWLGLGVLVGGITTLDSPSGQRLLIAVPALFLVAGVFARQIWISMARFFTSPRRRFWGGIALSGAASLVLIVNIYTYFGDYPLRATGLAQAVAKEFAYQSQEYRGYLMAEPLMYPSHGALLYLAYGANIQNLKSPSDFPGLDPDGGGVVIVVLERYLDDLREMESVTPGGQEICQRDTAGRILYYAYRVPPGGG